MLKVSSHRAARRLAASLLVVSLPLGGALALDLASTAPSLAGRWKMVVTAGDSTRDYFLELKQDGTKVAGTFISPRSGNVPFEGGSFLEGKIFKIEVPRRVEETTRIFAIEATLKESGKLEGVLRIDGAEAGSVVISREGSPIAGRWSVVTKTNEGQEYSSTLELADSGGSLKGKSMSQLGAFEIRAAVFDGAKLTYEIVLPINGNDVPFVVSAELKDANTLVGRWKTKEADFSGEWLATRQVAAPAPLSPEAAARAKALTGKWYTLAILPNGRKVSHQLELMVEAEKLAGKVHTPEGSTDLRGRILEGGKFELELEIGREGQRRQIKIEGELKDGSLKGKWSASNGESGEWEGRKPTLL